MQVRGGSKGSDARLVQGAAMKDKEAIGATRQTTKASSFSCVHMATSWFIWFTSGSFGQMRTLVLAVLVRRHSRFILNGTGGILGAEGLNSTHVIKM